MSRNLRHKSNPKPPKKLASKNNTSFNDSSDDDYAGVDLVSDDEDDEPDVEKAEEQVIIESEQDEDDSTPRPSIEDDQSSWDGFEMESQEVLGDTFFDDHMARMHAPDIDTEAAVLWAPEPSDDEPDRRRVRFDLSDSSSTASNDEDFGFPDLFVPQSSLDPAFRRQIEEDEANASSDEGYWDLRGADDAALEDVDDNDSDSSSGTGSSGYETDDGETTDEDIDIPVSSRPKYVPGARSLIREPSTVSESEEEVITRRTPARPNRSGPRLGVWTQRPDRPFAVMDSRGKKILMFQAKRRSSLNDMSRLLEYDSQDIEEISPMLSNSANLMMSAMTPAHPLFDGGDVLGPPEAFFPFTSISANGEISQDSPSSFDDDDMDEVAMWNMDEFLNLPGVEAGEDEDDSSPTDDPTSTPRPTTLTSEDQPQFLDSTLVGSWRSDKERHNQMIRNNATEDSLRFSSPHLHTTIKGIKEGRLANAVIPMTPMRKQKRFEMPIDSSPLATHMNKRKFSGEQSGHKRSKSMN